MLGAGLRLCGYRFAPAADEFLDAMFSVAQGAMGFEEPVDWARMNVAPDVQ